MSRIDIISRNGNDGIGYKLCFGTGKPVDEDGQPVEHTVCMDCELLMQCAEQAGEIMRDKCSGCMTACEGCKTDPVNSPKHYTDHSSGIECIQVTEHMNFCLGNAIKYIWRAGLKGDAKQDLEKAKWYIERELGKM
jgi:hypothetical protein